MKPSEKNPSINIITTNLLKQTNLPNNIFNIIHDNKNTINSLLTHPNITAISFINSTSITKHVYQSTTTHNKQIQTLNKTKNHTIVLPDTNLNTTTDTLIKTTYDSTKKRYITISTVITIGDTNNNIMSHLQEHTKVLTIDPNNKKNIKINPLITHKHLKQIKHYINIKKKRKNQTRNQRPPSENR